MTFFIPEQQDAVGAPFEGLPPTAGQVFSAAAQAGRVRQDSWGLRAKAEQSFYEEILTEFGDRITPLQDNPAWPSAFETKLKHIFDQIGTLDGQEGPTALAGMPRSKQNFDTEIARRLRAQFDEAQNVLGLQPEGAWVAEMAGGFWAGATDEATLLTLPFGLSTGAPLWKVVAAEFALGVASEAAMLPRQFEMADLLDLPEPDVIKQLGIAGATSGVLGGGISGALRYGSYVRTKRASARSIRPSDAEPLSFEATVSDAQTRLENDEPVRSQTEIKYPTFGKFDFSDGGNASPTTNRIGYVYGKLLELGYEPHIVAGLMGNLVQESGAGLSTRAVGDNGNAFGMGQWNGPRMRALQEFAKNRNADPSDLDTQIAFLDHELKGPEADAFKVIRMASNARDAARLASQAFWRPGIPNISARMANAEQVFSQFDNGSVPKWIRGVRSADTGVPNVPGRARGGEPSPRGQRTGRAEFEAVDPEFLRPVSPRTIPETAFADGANSPDAGLVNAASIEDLRTVVAGEPFGPVHTDLRDDPAAAISRLMQEKNGEVPDAVVHPKLGEIAFVYGNEDFGLRHIQRKRGDEMLARLPEILTKGRVVNQLADRAYVQLADNPPSSAVIRLDWDGAEKQWLVTAFEDFKGSIARQARTSDEPPASVSSRIPDTTGQPRHSGTVPENQGMDSPTIAALRADFGEMELEVDGATVRVSELIDDLEKDEALADILDLCNPKGGG